MTLKRIQLSFFALLLGIICLSRAVVPAKADTPTAIVNPPTDFLSCGNSYADWEKNLDGGSNTVIKACNVNNSPSIVDSSGTPIPNARIVYKVDQGDPNTNTQQGGDFPVTYATGAYKFCSFTQDWEKTHQAEAYPVVVSFYASADGYANSSVFTVSSSDPCHDAHGNAWGQITLQKSDKTYGCFQDGACKQVTSSAGNPVPNGTFGADQSCNSQCGVWNIYDMTNTADSSKLAEKYKCYSKTDPKNPPPAGATPKTGEQTYYLKNECDQAAGGISIQNNTGTNPVATPTPTPTPTPLPPLPPCASKIADIDYTPAPTPVQGAPAPAPGDAQGNFIYHNFTQCNTVATGLGVFVPTDPQGFIQSIFAILLSVSGGIAILLIIRSGYQMMTASGDPEKLKNAKEILSSAIIGLLFLIFSLIILEIIGVDLLHIPGLSH